MTGFRPLTFVGSAHKDLKAFPDAVQDVVGQALLDVQWGEVPVNAKPMKGFGGVTVMEIAEQYNTDTYRAVYTVRLQGVVYVLHCFQKKSKSGIATPREDIALIKARLVSARDMHKENYGK